MIEFTIYLLLHLFLYLLTILENSLYNLTLNYILICFFFWMTNLRNINIFETVKFKHNNICNIN